MIKIRDLNKSYKMGNNSLHVLKGINLDVEEGEFVAIMGTSGSGKSTLLNIIGMLDTHDSGLYELGNVVIEKLTEKKAANYRNKFLGFIFQSYNLISFKNVLENVALPLYYQKVSRSKRSEIALSYLERVGLTNWAHHMPNELSGGQKQRVAIARALAAKPKLLLADEPTGALDSKTSAEVMRLIQEINDEGKTILMVTHEDDIAKMCKRIVRLKDGMIMSDEQIEQKRVSLSNQKPEI
ncbi:MAG: ABC transporter ATP-binding protein [Weeksellaceae bacterium]|jgi:putative ABC transport system ATP-binding protein|nr:ABC transporter ATP-binding protein [Weeksellaceae bacterium]